MLLAEAVLLLLEPWPEREEASSMEVEMRSA
jgi:hypothetical protein